MKVLFDHGWPFFLAHGGFQIQIEQTASALRDIGVDVEFVRWWDATQRGDVIHYFGRPPGRYVELAREKGLKVVAADLFGGLGARPALVRIIQKQVMKACRILVPGDLLIRLNWDGLRGAHACVALTTWEAHLMTEIFDVPEENLHVIPNGVERVFLESPPVERGPWLVCTASIIPIKRIVELAKAAVQAQTPLWIVGQPFDPASAYHQTFLQLTRDHPKLLRYEGPIQSRDALAKVYRSARGFVLISRWETLSISALEAAACDCPLLLAALPWARSAFGGGASYCPVASIRATAEHLRKFYDAAPNRRAPAKRPLSWQEVAGQLRDVYQQLQVR